MERLVTGIYRIFERDGASYVGFSRNVSGTLKRLRFELTLNACSFRQLQAFWNQRGPLEMELLEELDAAGMNEIELDAHLKARLLAWKKRLGEETRVVQESV